MGLRFRLDDSGLMGSFSILLSLAIASAVEAQPRDEMSDDPAVERKLLTLPKEFEIQLVASEPEVINPVQINFDPQGRLWVLCIPRYPQLLPGQEPRDYVLVLEDIGPDGRACKSHVFADGLTVPTGLAPGDGGVYVGQADRLLHLKDTKGTGKADERRVLFAGFGTQDTHHTLNSFRWGPDGNLYFNQGIYIKSTVETPYGPRKLWGGCVWQLRPDRLRLEVHDRSILGTNTWGHIFDAWGQSFCTTAWPDGIHLVLPDSPLTTSTDKDVVPPLKLTRVADGRHCGATFITGRHFPNDWQGNLVSGSFAQQLIYRYQFSDVGGKFVGKQMAPLVTSKHRKFRPVDVQMGPDGALYVADWYDEVIQHNQIDFRDPRRDHSRGRIWRIVRKDRSLVTPPKLVGVPIDDVLEQLKAPEAFTRQQAKRALAERDAKEVAVALTTWVKRLDPKDTDLPHHLLEALWTAQTIDRIDVELLRRVLRSDDLRVRAVATRVLGAWHDRVPDALELLARLAADTDPRVRLEAVLAATRIPTPTAVEAAMHALDQPTDPLLDFAVRKAAIVLRPYWYPEFQKGRLTFSGNSRRLATALQAIQSPDSVRELGRLLTAGKIPVEARTDALCVVASLGADGQGLAWSHLCGDDRLTAADRTRVLTALEEAARRQPIKSGSLESVMKYIEDPNEALSAVSLRLAGAWKLENARDKMSELAGAEHPLRRRAAIAGLVDLGGERSMSKLATLATPGQPYGVRVDALVGLIRLDLQRAVDPGVKLLRQPTSATDDPGELYVAFLQRAGGAKALAAALRGERPSADAAKVGLRTLAALGTPAPELQQLLHEVAGVGGPARRVTAEETRRLLALVQKQGDATRGEAVFRRAALGCLQCHAIAGAGGRVGPDLGSIGTSSQLDYLLESILLPSKVIREGYNTAHVVMSDGRSISGVIVRESATELVLRNQTTDELVLAKRDIEERNGSGSLMPAGLEQLLTDAELADLVRFLSELGRPGPFAVGHAAVARRWRYLPAVTSPLTGPSLRSSSNPAWSTAYSTVAGDLPLADVRPANDSGIAVVRCEFEATSSGPVTLLLGDTQGLRLWLDGNSIEPASRLRLELDRGNHTLDFGIDVRRRPAPILRCEIVDGPARFVNGK
jgi:putative heme-binding domain-containing protein